MLSPKRTARKVRDFAAYDLEWYPKTLELRLVGVYDGDSYYHFLTVREFLRWALHEDRAGIWYYAHAGGLYDFQFLVEALSDSGYRVEAAFSGSAVIIARVSDGKNVWTFLDSYWLIRQPLRAIGEWLGYPKGECAFDAALPELIDYNERDCRLLYEAVDTMQSIILELGGELQVTIASTAMDLFRRQYLTDRIRILEEVNTYARKAYVGSRVEVIQKRPELAAHYDINSSFPYSMTWEAPGNLVKRTKGSVPSHLLFLAQVDIEIPEQHIPPLPYRKGARVFFPTGRWKTWLMGTDFYLAESLGTIHKVGTVFHFEACTHLREYVTDLYSRRKKAKAEGKGALEQALKIFLNSLYGKFAESSEKTKLFINPHGGELKGKEAKMLTPGFYLVTEERDIPHAHVPFSAHTTALSRRHLFEYMTKCNQVYYVDTDGFACDPASTFETGPELGQLKYEDTLLEPIFEAPKLYSAVSKETGKRILKAKGFNRIASDSPDELNRKLTHEDFLELLEHRELRLERFDRLRTMLRSGTLTPNSGITRKTYRGQIQPKRCFFPDGTSRPWDVGEV